MVEHWYHLVGGKQFGPYSFKGLRERATIGILHPDDEVLRDGAKDWIEAADVPGLFAPEAAAEIAKAAAPAVEPALAPGNSPWLLPLASLMAGIAIGMGVMTVIFSLSPR